MNKLPVKQIYLLIVIIVGIFVLSVYSTYSIFTLESSTNDIVNIKTPNNITLNTETYEYKQVIVPKNNYISTDIDIYNNTNDNLCYGIWYKVISNDLTNKVKIYENTESSLTTSGVIDSITSKRVNLLIINDNDTDVKVNIGLSHEKNSDSCSFKLTNDRELIMATINNPKVLSNTLIKNVEVTNNEEGYLIYKNNEEKIIISPDSQIHISKEFTYNKELFTLTDSELVNATEVNKYISNATANYYTCIELDKCNILYKINDAKVTEESISIDSYDTLKGYLSGDSGLRKDDNNYIFFGDNPHNFIYYNCKNELDISTCELWRIMGFYYNQQNNKYLTKIIKDSFIGTYTYDDNTNLFNNSKLFNYLNKEYKINNSLLTEINYEQENIITNEDESVIISYLPDKFKAQVTLMKLTDYLNASVCQNKNPSNYDKDCIDNNWLNKGLNEFTMSIKYEKTTIDSETEEVIIPDNNIVYTVGTSINETVITEKACVRPVVYLKERTMLLSGDGTIDNPYIIK